MRHLFTSPSCPFWNHLHVPIKHLLHVCGVCYLLTSLLYAFWKDSCVFLVSWYICVVCHTFSSRLYAFQDVLCVAVISSSICFLSGTSTSPPCLFQHHLCVSFNITYVSLLTSLMCLSYFYHLFAFCLVYLPHLTPPTFSFQEASDSSLSLVMLSR